MVGVSAETLWMWLGYRERRSKRSYPKSSRSTLTRKETEELEKKEGAEEEEEDEKALKLKIKENEENEEEDEEARRREKDAYLARVTHLHLERKGITHIENVGVCPGARVAFLQHNHLTRLANLRPLRLLQELFLQDNHITRLECLQELVSLRRLLVPGNRVGVVEGLPRGLQELHIQHQRLPPGDALVLDPHALATVQETLRVLDVSGNRLTELGAVGLLTRLQVLQVGDNDLCSLSHVTSVLGRLGHLREAHLVGNPVTTYRRYRPALILAASPTLELLDERDVTSHTREFLVQADRHRMIQREKLSRPPTHPQGDTPPPNSQEPIRMEKHLLFTSATPSDHTESVATGPRFVLGALRRPEFDLILRRAQQRSMAATASSLDVELQLGIREWSTLETAEGNVAPSNSREGLANQDSSGNDLTDTDAPSQEGVAHDPQWSTNLSPEKSVWFAGGEEPFIDDLPRLVPRPYWRNKPPVPRTNTTTTT